MSWFFGPAKSNLPPITPLQEQRSKQIESLKALNPNVIELKRDVEYRVTFSGVAGMGNIALHITLPAQFPQEKPLVKVSPPMRHPWISNTLTVIGCPGLNNFGVHTDLGRIIQSIIQELRTNPPFIFTADPVQANASSIYPSFTPSTSISPPTQYPLTNPQSIPGYRALTPAAVPATGILLQGNQSPSTSLVTTQSTHQQASSSGVTQNTDGRISNEIGTLEFLGIEPIVVPTGLESSILAPRTYSMPPVPASLMDQLGDPSTSQLQEILDSEEEELKIFAELSEVKTLLSKRKELYDVCEQLAQTNLSYQPVLDKLKARITELVQERDQQRNRFDMSCLNQQRISEQLDPRHTLDILRVAAADVEHESEAKADVFLEGGSSVEEFLREYTRLRKKMHLRRAKEEKLDYMLRQGVAIK